MTTCTCPDNCGRPVYKDDLSGPCRRRWVNAGRPASGAPPKMTSSQRNALARAAALEAAAAPDATDIEFARRRRAERWERADERLYRAARFAADMARTVQSGDRFGWRTLWARMDDPWAVMTAFALCADPDLLMAGPDEPERSERSA